eukprot:SAG22_NODE_48_length_24654_cov_4.406394_25_plen_566_part_00
MSRLGGSGGAQDDHYLVGAEFWVNRTLAMADQAAGMRVAGWSGIHWRTFETSLTISALAQSGWRSGSSNTGGTAEKLTVETFYRDFASSAFGEAAGPEAAAILTSLDSFQPGYGQAEFPDRCDGGATCADACYSGGGGHCRRRQPPFDAKSFSCCAKWSSDPAQSGSAPALYTYADRFASLAPKVPAQNLEVYKLWGGLLNYTQQLAETQQAVIKLKAELTVEAAAAASAAYTKMLTTLQGFVHTPGSLGLIVQHENMNYAANFGPPLQQLAKKLGHPVPAAALPSQGFAGPPRLFCLTVRTLLAKEEATLELPMILLASERDTPSTITVFYRSLVSSSGPPQQQVVQRTSAARGWFKCAVPVPADGEDFEWWAEAPTLNLRYPETANASVVVVVDQFPSLKSDDDGSAKPRPHILFALADDTGWNSVGWHARSNAARLEVSTPNLDALVRSGIELTRSYAFKYCSPSRCSIQSGRNPIHVQTGNANFGIGGGIPANMTCLATKLKQRGYRTVMAGKVRRNSLVCSLARSLARSAPLTQLPSPLLDSGTRACGWRCRLPAAAATV